MGGRLGGPAAPAGLCLKKAEIFLWVFPGVSGGGAPGDRREASWGPGRFTTAHPPHLPGLGGAAADRAAGVRAGPPYLARRPRGRGQEARQGFLPGTLASGSPSPRQPGRSGRRTSAGSAACDAAEQTCRTLWREERPQAGPQPAQPAANPPGPARPGPLALQQSQVLGLRGGECGHHGQRLLEVVIPLVGGQRCHELAIACGPQGPAGIGQVGAYGRGAPLLCSRGSRPRLRRAARVSWWEGNTSWCTSFPGSHCGGAEAERPPGDSPPAPGPGPGTFGEWPGGQVGPALVQVRTGVQLPGCSLGQGQCGVGLPPTCRHEELPGWYLRL